MSLSDQEVTKLYVEGKNCAEIARMDTCSETTIYNRLKSLRVKIRSRSEANQIFPDSAFISLYNVGLSASQIGRFLGVDSSTVKKRLHTLKFPLRSRGVASKIRYNEEEFNRHFMTPEVVGRFMELVCE
jgi:DNA-directed RNA polymerase specialized sigma24 family protein